MRVYEAILSILEEKGVLPLTEICHEVNKVLYPLHEKILLPSHIKSVVTKKRELFHIDGCELSINPDKYPITLQAILECYEGVSYQIRVNFIKNKFIALEWKSRDSLRPISDLQQVKPGRIEDFKRELYSLNIWGWESCYDHETGIVLDGKHWSVSLITKGKIYKSEGTASFPTNWNKFCKEIEKLTGTTFR